MAALTDNRDTVERASAHSQRHAGVGLSSTQFYKGGIIAYDSADGLVKKGVTSTTLIAIGRCEENVLTGAGNTRKINGRSGIFKYGNSASADLIAEDDVGKPCYIVDDATVALTDGTGTRSRAGIIDGVDTDGGVFVSFTKAVSIS